MGPPEIDRRDKGKAEVELHSMTGGDSSQPTLAGPTLHRGIGRSPSGAPPGRLASHQLKHATHVMIIHTINPKSVPRSV